MQSRHRLAVDPQALIRELASAVATYALNPAQQVGPVAEGLFFARFKHPFCQSRADAGQRLQLRPVGLIQLQPGRIGHGHAAAQEQQEQGAAQHGLAQLPFCAFTIAP